MYEQDSYQEYPEQLFNQGYHEDYELNSQYAYDYNDQRMMMSQPRMSLHSFQMQQPKYIDYEMPSLPGINSIHLANNYPKMVNRGQSRRINQQIPGQIAQNYMIPQRRIPIPQQNYYLHQPQSEPSFNHFQKNPALSNGFGHIPLPSLNQSSSYQQFVPIQTYQILSKRYRQILLTMKRQNNELISKLKLQRRKFTDFYNLIKEFVLNSLESDQENTNFQMANESNKFIDHMKNASLSFKDSYQAQENDLMVPPDNSQIYDDYHFEETQNQQILNYQHENQQNTDQIFQKAQILQRKIKNLNTQKTNQQKIKLQLTETQSESQRFQTIQKPTQTILINSQSNNQQFLSYQGSVQSQKKGTEAYEEPDEHQMYPNDFSDQESYLVDHNVQQAQNMKKTILKKQTFGRLMPQKSPQTPNYRVTSQSFKHKSGQEFKNQALLIDEFYQFFCEKIEYAPRSQFAQFKIKIEELLGIYLTWKQKKLGNRTLTGYLTDKKLIENKLVSELKKRFNSCRSDRFDVIGIKYKDKDFVNDFCKQK